MTTKLKIIFGAVALLSSFAAGRWLAPTKVVTETKTVTVEHEKDKTDTKKDEHKVTVITKKPDGTTQTVITDDSHTGTKTSDTKDIASSTDTKREVDRDSSKVTISALGVINTHVLNIAPTYGAMISKPILGPLTLGAMGLANGEVGMSIGLTF